ncbi:MAG: YIEGIA family protein [Deltaproteobacteria bacterium]
MEPYGIIILCGVLTGVIDRWIMLRSDYRHYPSYPHGEFVHLSLGLIAASLGAVAVPAIAKPDYTAVTFLALAAQQFREVRSIERETLLKLEETKIIRRGTDYIEGIARVFEARNYLVILSALFTSAVVYYYGWPLAFPAALLCFVVSLYFMKGSYIGDIALIEEGIIDFENSILKVNDVVMMNVGLPATREKIRKEGMGIIIKPINDDARLTLDTPGQRMAIMHDVVSILGSKVDINESELAPIMRKQPDQGYLAFFLVANEPDLKFCMEIIKRVPVLESARSTSSRSYYGRKAAD